MFKLSVFMAFALVTFSLLAKQTISICYEEWSPYAYEENAKHSGDIVEWLTRDLHKQAISIEFYEYPYARCIKEVKKGKIDFSLFVDQSDDLELVEYELVDWQLAVVSKRPALTKQDFWEGNDKNIIIANDYEYPELINNKLVIHKKRILPISYFLANGHETKSFFNLIVKEHADFMIVDKVWSQMLIKKYDIPLYVSEWNLISVPQYIGFSKHTQQSKIDSLKSILSSRAGN